jgi:hypothetical protein
MRFYRISAAVAVLASGVMLAGCTQQSAAPASMSQREPGNAVTAGSKDSSVLPLPVSASFHREFPTAGITQVVPSTTETGRSFYRVTYIANGTPGSVNYYLDGTRLTPQPSPVAPPVVTPNRGVPSNTPSSTPRVGQP